ncbi:MAG: LysR family transcriptional regulator [Paucibacter sp.]|nr:LysR family transcriptional regulator [Roseateles sp.]
MNLFVSLRYLVALDDHRHFGRAALACHVTQPALSNAIRALEASFGVAVVKRGRSFAGFTPEGERILASARRILHEHELLQQDLLSSAEQPRGNLMLGAVPTAMPVAACFAALLRERHPSIKPTLRSMSSVEIETGLESLALDMGLGYTERLDSSNAPLRMLAQYSENYFLLSRHEGRPAARLQYGPAITWAEAARRPLCLLSPEMHNRTVVDRAFVAAGDSLPEPAIETNAILTLAVSVVAGRVCSILPGSLLGVIKGYGELEARPLIEPRTEIPIAFMAYDTNRPSRALEAALAFAQDPLWLECLGQFTAH